MEVTGMADKIRASALIETFRVTLAEKWGYIWGKRGQVWTQASQDAATREMTRQYGQKWVGRKVADCSGLFVWAYKRFGLSIYHGSNTIYNKYTTEARSVVADGILIRPGAAVFQVNSGKRTHIGLYVGGGKCIEAKGTQSGVVESDISDWDEWAELADVDYTGMAQERITAAPKTLRKGDKGAQVTQLQELLNADPRYPTKVDGIFGGDTLASVRAFQHDHGLEPDGIVGPLTWAALRAVEDDEPGEAKPEEEPSLTLEERLERLEDAVFGQEGGESDGS
jgi:hypothetical protein